MLLVSVAVDYPPASGSLWPPVCSCDVRCGPEDLAYRHMGRFRGNLMFRMQVIQEYDYVWILDTGTGIKEAFPCDPFRSMADNRAVFGWFTSAGDQPQCTGDLTALAAEYMRERGMEKAAQPLFLERSHNGFFFMGCSVFFKTSFFSSRSISFK